jgi:predicted nucleic acid-binding protein
MKDKLFLDTNIVLYYMSGNIRLNSIVKNSLPYISFINKIELLSGTNLSKADEKSIRKVLNYINVIDYNDSIGEIAIEYRIKHKLKLADAIIAATATFLNIPIITADKEFLKVKELNLVLFEI